MTSSTKIAFGLLIAIPVFVLSSCNSSNFSMDEGLAMIKWLSISDGHYYQAEFNSSASEIDVTKRALDYGIISYVGEIVYAEYYGSSIVLACYNAISPTKGVSIYQYNQENDEFQLLCLVDTKNNIFTDFFINDAYLGCMNNNGIYIYEMQTGDCVFSINELLYPSTPEDFWFDYSQNVIVVNCGRGSYSEAQAMNMLDYLEFMIIDITNTNNSYSAAGYAVQSNNTNLDRVIFLSSSGLKYITIHDFIVHDVSITGVFNVSWKSTLISSLTFIENGLTLMQTSSRKTNFFNVILFGSGVDISYNYYIVDFHSPGEITILGKLTDYPFIKDHKIISYINQ